MSRIMAAFSLLLGGVLVASGMWMLSSPAVTPFIVPGVTDVQVVNVGWGQRQISYRAPSPPYAWYFTVTRNLVTSGFRPLNRWRESPTYDPIVPLRFEREYAGVLWDEVVLTPDPRDPQRATITVRRRIVILCWRSWLPAGEGPNQKNVAQIWPASPRHQGTSTRRPKSSISFSTIDDRRSTIQMPSIVHRQ